MGFRKLEKLDRTNSERMGDLHSDSPRENVYYLCPRSGVGTSVRQACREGGSSSSLALNPIVPTGLEQGRGIENCAYVQACARHTLLGRELGRGTSNEECLNDPWGKTFT